jgi:stearoyl-CoA 9-desaturase NADPH oxidoreductase
MGLFNVPAKFKTFFNESLFNSNSYKNYLEPMLESWMPGKSLLFTKARVEQITLEREDVISLVLSPDKKWKGFIPGQFIQITMEIKGVLYHRIFSISSALKDFQETGQIRLSIQKQHLGKVTTSIFEDLNVGDYLNISEAMGVFTLQNVYESRLLMIAGGVGITPILSMLKSVEDNSLSILVLYYATSSKHHLFEKELLEISQRNKNITIHKMNSDEVGFFSSNHLQNFCPDFKERDLFLCGPEAMDKHVRNVLAENNFNVSKVYAESFTAQKSFNPDSKEIKQVNITLEKSKKEFTVTNDKSILELLENNGQQPKYGCRMGICNQCSCKKVSGVVFNQHDNQLSGTGEEYIKICSTIPMGDIKIEL